MELYCHASRTLYNKILEIQLNRHEQKEKRLSNFSCCKLIPDLKKKYESLKNVPVETLRHSVVAVENSYKNFFSKRAGFPKFKSRHHSKMSFTCGQGIRIKNGKITVAGVGRVKFVEHKKIEGKIKKLTVTLAPSGRVYGSVLIEKEGEHPTPYTPKSTLGMDEGISHFLTLSDKKRIENPRHTKRLEKLLRRRNKSVSRKKKGSNRRAKAKKLLARTHERIANSRKFFHHHLAWRLVTKAKRETQALAFQDVKIKNLVKNRKLSKSLIDLGFGDFKTILKDKVEREGVPLYIVDSFQATSKTCSNCDYKLDGLPLNIRTWNCKCGSVHERDVNAARNIARWGAPSLRVEGSCPCVVASATVENTPTKREKLTNLQKSV